MMGRIYLAIIAGLLGGIVWLVISIKGFGPIEGLEQKLEVCREVVNALSAEGDKAVAVSTAVAREGDQDHAENLAVTSAAARRHIERNRVRPQVSRAASGPASVPGSAGPAATLSELDPGSDPGSVPEAPRELAAGEIIWREEDVLICTTNYELAWTAYDFIQDAKEAGLMQPVTPAFPEPALSVEPQPAQ